MTNFIEKKSESADEERERLEALIEQIQLGQKRIKVPTSLLAEMKKPIVCPMTGEPLQYLSPEEMEKRRFGSYGGFGDFNDYQEEEEEEEEDGNDLTKNPFDSNSDEDSFSESDGDDDSRSYFPCPYCYMEIEVPVLCSHLQQEHCFDMKNAVCPLCAANLGRDATAHFRVHHSSSLKRRRKPEKSNSSSRYITLFGKKVLANARANRFDSTTDLLLHPFLCDTAIQNSDSVHQDELSNNNVSAISDGNRAGDEKDQQEKKERADFVQQLLFSTMF